MTSSLNFQTKGSQRLRHLGHLACGIQTNGTSLDYAEWPRPDESEEEIKFAQLQDVEFESWLKSVSASEDEWPELIE